MNEAAGIRSSRSIKLAQEVAVHLAVMARTQVPEDTQLTFAKLGMAGGHWQAR